MTLLSWALVGILLVRWPGVESVEDGEILDVFMPGARTSEPDTYLCTTLELKQARAYITGFIPVATMNTAHHVLMYSCEEPGLSPMFGPIQPIWRCGHGVNQPAEGDIPIYPKAGICRSNQRIIYAWAKDADELSLPEDTGFEVGKETPAKWIVLQVHYKKTMNTPDHSGVQLRMTKESQHRKAGVFVLGSYGTLPPRRITYLEILCPMNHRRELHPFAFRTHTHALGRVVSGFLKSDQSDEWREIGKMDPQRPQMFYPVKDKEMVIRHGDHLAARCTLVNDRNDFVAMGATSRDEMCNFYVMYYTEQKETEFHGCWSRDDDVQLPSGASTFMGTVYVEGDI